MPAELDILGLEWDEEREAHVEEHVFAWEVEELIEGQDFFAFRNTKGHPPNRWMIIGRAPGGRFLTVILEQPSTRDPYNWIPITAWPATPKEQSMYNRERRRQAKKR
jgi:hypothetical protein